MSARVDVAKFDDLTINRARIHAQYALEVPKIRESLSFPVNFDTERIYGFKVLEASGTEIFFTDAFLQVICGVHVFFNFSLPFEEQNHF